MKKHLRFMGFVALCLLLNVLLPTSKAHAATFTVNSTGDASDRSPGDGLCDYSVNPGLQCTLRAALEEVNALGGASTHYVTFSIAGSGPFTLAPGSPLPAVTAPTGILSNTQTGTSCPGEDSPAELQIVLDGSNAGANADGLVFAAGSDGSLVDGIAVGHFDGAGMRIMSDNNEVSCSHFGVHADGVSPMGNGYGIYISGNGNVIGGVTSPARRNVISDNIDGIRIQGDGNEIVDNFIGTTADGMQALGNDQWGLFVSRHGNTFRGNVISSNDDGIMVYGGDDNVIQGNIIGLARDGAMPLPNRSGIAITNEATGNIVGGLVYGQDNVVAHNWDEGVTVYDSIHGIPTGNTFRGNRIFDNGNLGIDLGDDGVTPNDYRDIDGGENERQNYPVLLPDASSSVLVAGRLNSIANRQYTIDLYANDGCDPSGYGQGQAYLTTTTVTTNGSGNASFQVDVSYLPVAPGDSISATATDAAENTSEFSACMTVPETATPTPTHTATATQPATPGPSPTATSTATPGPSLTPTHTPTPGPSPTATHTVTPGPSPTATATGVPRPVPANVVYLPMMLTR